MSLFQLVILMPLKYILGRIYHFNDSNIRKQRTERFVCNGERAVTLVNSFLLLALSVSIFITRCSHAGQVCSGDYLDDSGTRDIGNRRVYDLALGRFLIIILIANAVILSFGCLCCLVCTVLIGSFKQFPHQTANASNNKVVHLTDLDEKMKEK